MNNNKHGRCEVCDSPMGVECNCFCDCGLPHLQCCCGMQPEDFVIKKDIVKVQVDHTGKTILIYNKDRTIMKQFEDKKIAHKLGGPLSKRYMEYEIKDGYLELGNFAKDYEEF